MVYFISKFPGHSLSLIEITVGTEGKNPKQELKQKPWWIAAYWLAPQDDSAYFLS